MIYLLIKLVVFLICFIVQSIAGFKLIIKVFMNSLKIEQASGTSELKTDTNAQNNQIVVWTGRECSVVNTDSNRALLIVLTKAGKKFLKILERKERDAFFSGITPKEFKHPLLTQAEEITLNVGSYLNPKSIACLGSTCKYLHDLSKTMHFDKLSEQTKKILRSQDGQEDIPDLLYLGFITDSYDKRYLAAVLSLHLNRFVSLDRSLYLNEKYNFGVSHQGCLNKFITRLASSIRS